MMREFMGLYRGKRSNGEWVEGFYMNLGGKYHYILTGELDITGAFPFLVKYEVDPDTVGECIGLRDKNGKLAFEHDITEDQWGRRWILFGCEGGFGICRNSEWIRNSPIIYNALADVQNAEWFSNQHEIIGNATDNPELLKGGEGDG